MGTWGTDIFSDDEACDIRQEYNTLAAYLGNDAYILMKMKDYFKVSDVLNCMDAVFWYAMAAQQVKYGRVCEEVRKNALECINRRYTMDGWYDTKDCSKREKVLNDLKIQLLSEDIIRRKVSKPKKEKAIWKENNRTTYSNTSRKLSDPKTDINTLLQYNYVCDTFGTAIISAQQESTWMGSVDYEVDYIKKVSGKYPAMRGLDFMNDDFDGCVERAKKWHEMGGLVTICWHCGVDGKGYQESLADDPDYSKLLKKGTAENTAMLKSWDKAAAALSELQDAGVPVFWRPFHEFDGQWFWWGKGGKDNFIALWREMYNYFTEEKGLHNLIWVLGYADDVKSGWYPGDEYCDIIGSDTYKSAANKKGWDNLNKLNTGKPLVFHECGAVPAVSEIERNGGLWGWFMVWHTEYIINTPRTDIKKTYTDEKVITLDELPEFK